MKTQPLKGMRDLLPREQALRDYIQGQILATYRAAGFQRISTPILEDMENLDKSEGGDNLNLIFKVLKRGDKLEHALASGDEKQLSDMGLRYDLTLPLSRYYAANRNELPSPFKVIQTDRVYRAERPQKGRLREFVQCDIDILGDSSPNAEVELIDVTARALLKIGFTGFTININDRRILRAMLEKMGFAADQPCRVKEMWKGKDVGTFKNAEFAPILRSHASGLYRVSAVERTEGASVAVEVPSGELTAGEPFEVKITVSGGPSEGAYVQLLCGGEIIGTLPVEADGTARYTATLYGGTYMLQAKYSGTTAVASAVSDECPVTVGGASEDLTQLQQRLQSLVDEAKAIVPEEIAGALPLWHKP